MSLGGTDDGSTVHLQLMKIMPLHFNAFPPIEARQNGINTIALSNRCYSDAQKSTDEEIRWSDVFQEERL